MPARPGIPPHPVQSDLFSVKVGGETLAEATTRLSTSLDLHTTLESTAQVVVEHMADYCLVDVRLEEGQGLERMAAAARRPGTQPYLEELLRLSPPTIPDSPIWRVLETGHATLLPEVSEEMLERASSVDAQHRTALELLRPSSVMMVPLVARGRTLGVLSVVSQEPTRRYTEHDLELLEDLAGRAALAVDNARLFQRAEQAVKARDEFVAIATHELRTPLSALSLQLVALQRAVDAGLPPSPEKLKFSLVTAQRQTERLELEREEVDLSSLVHWVVTRFAEKLAEAGMVAQVHAPAPVVARVDRLRVEQVLMNLLSNAMKYAPGLPVELRVEQEDGMAALSVRDHGPGISQEQQARIFERYQRASGQHSRESLGLGLYVARQIARAHGGELTVESTPGQGSRFLLRLPLG